MHKNIYAPWNTHQSGQDSVTISSALHRGSSVEAMLQSHGNYSMEITAESKAKIKTRVSEASLVQFQILLIWK